MPSRGTLSTSNTHTSLETEYDRHHEDNLEYPVKDYSREEEEEEEENFETTRLHFQQNKSTSISSANKYKMEMENRSGKREENLKSIVPFVKQISGDNVKVRDDYSINGESPLYQSTTQPIKIWAQVIVLCKNILFGYSLNDVNSFFLMFLVICNDCSVPCIYG